jgi:membrane protease YdiL (CAAX protease family)
VMVVDALLLGSLVPLIRRRHLGRRDLGLRGTRLGTGAVLAVAALVVYLVLTVLWTLAVIHPANSTQTFSRQLSISSHPGTLAVILDCFALAVSAPVCEEIFFRGLLFRSLRNRLPLWAAALIAGSLFGLAHVGGYPLDTIPIKMLFGVLMCLLYERTGSLAPCIAVHSFVDGSSADALFAGNLDIALALTGLVLVIVALRTMISASREVRVRTVAAAVAEPGARWPPPPPTR